MVATGWIVFQTMCMLFAVALLLVALLQLHAERRIPEHLRSK
jgi:hypothetical protein